MLIGVLLLIIVLHLTCSQYIHRCRVLVMLFDQPPCERIINTYSRTRHTGQARLGNEDYSPISGSGFFAQAMAVGVGQSGNAAAGPSTFRVYYTPPTSLHQSKARTLPDEDDEDSPVVYVCHHGAGYSAMSFALLSKALVERSKGKAGILALDCRGHGMSAFFVFSTRQLMHLDKQGKASAKMDTICP